MYNTDLNAFRKISNVWYPKGHKNSRSIFIGLYRALNRTNFLENPKDKVLLTRSHCENTTSNYKDDDQLRVDHSPLVHHSIRSRKIQMIFPYI